ncbi:MAG: anti-sigma factor antagonist [Actinobacteria bacterium]|nr:anti-sigma factor antagonist [Actinomycetota bacterium]
MSDPGGDGPLTLALPPTLDSTTEARRFACQAIGDQPGADLVALLTSELAANAVLHARTPFAVSVERVDRRIRVAVSDGSVQPPVVKHHSLDAVTGRGMRIIASHADDWGFDVGPDGKSVWFEVVVAPRPHDAGPEAVRLRLLCLPVDLYAASSAHAQAVLREVALMAPGPARDRWAPLLAETERFRDLMVALTDAVDVTTAARVGLSGDDSVLDVDVEIPRDAGEVAAHLAEEFETLDRDEVTTSVRSEQVRDFQRWMLSEIASQCGGEAPRPWPGGAAESAWPAPVEPPASAVHLSIDGDVDAARAGELRSMLHDAHNDGARSIVLDMSGVTFLDSSGVSMLMAAHARCLDAGGTFTVAQPSIAVRRILRIVGLEAILRTS